jgi:urea carboxylase
MPPRAGGRPDEAMIYDTPKILTGGDRYALVEFGDEMNLELNFLGQNLAMAMLEHKLDGVIETAACYASMLVHYEPEAIRFEDLAREILRLVADLGAGGDIELDSRLFYIPAAYLDPWTRAAIDEYREKINPDKEYDPDFIARINGLEDADHFVRVHAGTEYWTAALGFWPGANFLMPLDPRCKLVTPKYNPPRTFTPEGALGMGGASSCIYPVATPGGYQIFGRCPVPTWDTRGRFPEFEGNICLFRPTDRVRFIPCSLEEFDEIERKVADQSYRYNIVEYQRFSVKNYRYWVSGLDPGERF